jgi:hypothetical protein
LEGWHENGEKDVEKKEDTYVAEGRGDSYRMCGTYHYYYMPSENSLRK